VFSFPVPSLEDSYSNTDLTTPLAGVLVVQDIQLGFLVAIMPFMVESDANWLLWALQLLQVISGFPLLLFLTRGLTSRLLESFYTLGNITESYSDQYSLCCVGSLRRL